MLRLHVSQVKQRYEITPECKKGANNETENHTRLLLLFIIFIMISLTHKSLRANNVLNALVHRCRLYLNTAACLVTIRGVFIQVSRARESELYEKVIQ